MKGEKAEVEEVEAAVDNDLTWANRDDAHNDLDRHPGFWGKFLKKNPSPEFLADVAKMNATDLDPAQVKRVERRMDLLIIPALSICYMVRHFCHRTTLRLKVLPSFIMCKGRLTTIAQCLT